MAKACIKKDLHHLEKEIDDLIMLEDSARGTLCAIHKTIHSTENFPCSKHKMMRICPVPKLCYIPSTTRTPVLRSRKTRSSSPCCHEVPKMFRPMSANNEPYRSGCRSGILAPHTSLCSNYNVEKTISCPEKMCCESQQSNRSGTGVVTTSMSSVQINKFAQSLINTDEVVSELKGEIEKVKHQLHHISQQKLCDTKNENTKSSYETKTCHSKVDDPVCKLRNENRKLKREIEVKRRLLEKSRAEVEKAKDILLDYEKKVSLLHTQALKSSKTMRLSKEKFFSCLKDREDKIKHLKYASQILESRLKEQGCCLNEKDQIINNINEDFEKLKVSFEETCAKCSAMTESNQNFYESIEMLRDQLIQAATENDTHKETIKKLEQKLVDLNTTCKKVASRTRKQKINFETQVKTHNAEKKEFLKKISELSEQLKEMEQHKRSLAELQTKCDELQEKVKTYEIYSEKCKDLEEQCKELYEKLITTEESFKNDKDGMCRLITELTTIVQSNKVTILQMTDINKHQEDVIKTQSTALLTKEEQLKLIEKESETFKIKNQELEKEVEDLKKSFSEPCSKEACICISRELEECRNALNVEKDTHLLKEKIIQDQSHTILNLQSQVKEKMFELNKAQSDTMYLEEEISKINEKLIRKHRELDKEVDEKESLIEKLRILECQRNQLTEEIGDFEEMLHGFKETCGDNEKQQRILRHLETQIQEQKQQWDIQKEAMAKEKMQAVCAAKFATQKLLDTVGDFQRQVDAQKKVQLLLTKMLHEKDQQLRIVTSKISNINNITQEITGIPNDTDLTMKELFFRKALGQQFVPSDGNTNTNTSIYSSCSSCCKRPECVRNAKLTNSEKFYGGKENKTGFVPCKPPCTAPCIDTSQLFKFLNSIEKIQEEPSRDFS